MGFGGNKVEFQNSVNTLRWINESWVSAGEFKNLDIPGLKKLMQTYKYEMTQHHDDDYRNTLDSWMSQVKILIDNLKKAPDLVRWPAKASLWDLAKELGQPFVDKPKVVPPAVSTASTKMKKSAPVAQKKVEYTPEEIRDVKLDEAIAFLKSKLDNGALSEANIQAVLKEQAMLNAVLLGAIRGSFFKDAAFQKKVEEYRSQITKLNEFYQTYIEPQSNLPGNKQTLRDQKFEAFLEVLAVGAGQKILEGIVFFQKDLEKEKDPEKLKDLYKQYLQESWPRILVARRLAEVEVYSKSYTFGYTVDTTKTPPVVGTDVVVLDSQGKEVTWVNLELTKEDLEYLVIERWQQTLGVQVDNYGKKHTIEKLLTKYSKEIQDGSAAYTYEDLFYPEKKEAIIKSIGDALAAKPDAKKRAELMLLLQYVRNPKIDPKQEGKIGAQLTLAGVMRDVTGKPIDYTQYQSLITQLPSDPSKSISGGFLGDIMWANGGMTGAAIMIFSIIGLFFEDSRNWVLGGWAAILWITTIEEVAKERGWWDSLKQSLPESAQGVLDSAESMVSWPDYTVKNPSRGMNYNSMYEKNKAEWEKKRLGLPSEKSLDEETFAQIYVQLSNNNDFKKLTVQQLRSVEQGVDISTVLTSGLPTKFEAWLIEVSGTDRKLHNGKSISKDQLIVFVSLLIDEQEEQYQDVTAADLFVEWGKKEVTTFISGETFKGENKVISDTFDSIPESDPHKEKLGRVLGMMNAWSLDNGQVWALDTLGLSALKEKREQAKKASQSITDTMSGISGPTAIAVTTIVWEFTKIESKLKTQIEIQEWLKKLQDEWDLWLWGGEWVAKSVWNNVAVWLAVAVGYFNLDPNWTLQRVREANVADIDTLIQQVIKLQKKAELPKEQQESLKDTLSALQKKKLTLLRAKTDTATGVDKTRYEGLANDQLALMINVDVEWYEKKIDAIKDHVLQLSKNPSDESMSTYITLFISNFDNIKALQQLASANEVILKSADEKKVRTDAQDLLKHLQGGTPSYVSNLQTYVIASKGKLTDTTTGIRWQITAARDLQALWVEEQNYEKIRDEFMKPSIIDEMKWTANKYVFDTPVAVDDGNILEWMEVMLKGVGITINLDHNDMKSEIDAVKIALDSRKKELAKEKARDDFSDVFDKALAIKQAIAPYDFSDTAKWALVTLFAEYQGLLNEHHSNFEAFIEKYGITGIKFETEAELKSWLQTVINDKISVKVQEVVATPVNQIHILKQGMDPTWNEFTDMLVYKNHATAFGLEFDDVRIYNPALVNKDTEFKDSFINILPETKSIYSEIENKYSDLIDEIWKSLWPDGFETLGDYVESKLKLDRTDIWWINFSSEPNMWKMNTVTVRDLYDVLKELKDESFTDFDTEYDRLVGVYIIVKD